MSDDLTVMGIAATAAAAMGREQIVLAHQAEHPLAGNPDVATDPKPSPDLAVALALPGRCLQVGFDRHQQRLVRDRGLRSPTLCRRLLGVLAGGHGVERGAGHAPGGADPPQAVGQTRAGRGGGTHRRDLRRPKGPKVSVLASSSSTCMVNSPIRFMALSSSACTGSPLRCLSEASIPPIAFSRHCSSRKISTPNWRDRSCTGSSAKAAERPHACAPPSIAGQVPAGRPAWTSQARPHLPQADRSFSSLDTSIKPILCPRPGPTLRPTGAAEVAPARHAKAAERPHACAPPSIAGQVPAGRPAKPGLGKTWTSQARPHLPQAHQQQLSSQNYRSCSGPPWTLRLSQFCVQGNRVRLKNAQNFMAALCLTVLICYWD